MSLGYGNIGLAVRYLRHRRGWSQEELCWRAGLDRTYVSRLERGGNVRVNTLIQVADALEVRLSRVVLAAERIEAGKLKVARPEPRPTRASPRRASARARRPRPRPRE